MTTLTGVLHYTMAAKPQRRRTLAGYVIVESVITDEAVFNDYLERVPPVVGAHGGKYLARGGATQVVQGDWTPNRIVVMEFDSAEQARAWQDSSDYAELKAMLNRSSNTNVIIVEGV